ncbi:MAG: nuclear transport factor 2 family protein [Chitinophagaceae bacterium]|nr:nuclear transport factor 2 family protein [Chitinophagaceae bacterium]
MDQKEHLLNEANTLLNDLGFGGVNDLDLMENLLARNIMAIGTAKDEIYFTIQDVRDMVRRQKEQAEGMNLRYRKNELYRSYSPGSDDAIIVDSITLLLDVNDEVLEITFRFTTVYKFLNAVWKVLHFHASKPENVESESDSLGIEEWRKKAEELEKLVAERTSELSRRNTELNEAIQKLKETQAQLIQSEKMASLGELTAGIAHEIQNPLNFVNNFSEVNSELIAEMKQEIDKGNLQEAKSIADSIDENEQKIISHGKRADAIVKGMLQHSRSSSGQKELTDINALADEYLRLAYHGLRAKDKSFNATMKTDFDESIGNINIIPQDIGRVILNLITNAFYVVNEKKTLRQAQGDIMYEPLVEVTTKKEGNKVLISVKDNGNGIPPKVLDKIFQPFFTTKPTGQGTGLGLSLSYDIVKAHGGELKVETKENEGTQFIIQLNTSN